MRRIFESLCICVCASILFAGHSLADWPRFRGPNGTGIAMGKAPTEWSPNRNLRWKVPLPGPGVSSPIIVNGRVFVTCYSGYGESRENIGRMEDLQRHLLCVDLKSGELLWQRDVPSTVPEDPYTGPGIPTHGYASHTPASDGRYVYVFFGKSGVMAFDMDGNQKWRTSVGTDSDPRRWGSSSSPIVYEDVVIVTAGPESRAMVGLDKRTGEELWRAPADAFGMVWGTPAIVQTEQGADVVIGAPYEIWALNPRTGKLTWYCGAMETDQFSSSVVVDGQRVYAIEGRGGGSIALTAGGQDDITQSNVLWSGRDSSRFATPIVYENRLYYFNNGVVTCLNAENGQRLFQGRLRDAGSSAEEPSTAAPERGNQRGGGGRGFGGRGGFGGGGMVSDFASPVLADGKIYYVNRSGVTFVLEAGAEFHQIAANRVTEEAEQFAATPAISDGALVMRSNKHLYCIAEDQ
ncbi:MAG: serine/threonine protein kinase [Planctomycetota bacterium]|nr:MAG: serine/threonine protein kinase [Planctomycetota bacterium]